MAGKIVADQLEHSTAGSLDTQFVVSGTTKGYAYWNQLTNTIVDSLNTSSFTDVGTGVGGINWSSAMSSATYMCTTGAPTVATNTAYCATTMDDGTYDYQTKTATFWPFNTAYSGDGAGKAYFDSKGSICSAMGDLA